ncbi:MAG: PCRF domain-containing protein, partial [Deltaproteobacteria bacterium]
MVRGHGCAPSAPGHGEDAVGGVPEAPGARRELRNKRDHRRKRRGVGEAGSFPKRDYRSEYSAAHGRDGLCKNRGYIRNFLYYNYYFISDHPRERNPWQQEFWQKKPPCLSHVSTIFGATFEVERKNARLIELEAETAKEGLWDSPEKAESLLKERKALETVLAKWGDISKSLEDLRAYLELYDEEEDPSLAAEIEQHAESLSARLDELEMERMLSGESDDRNAIVTIHAGAGGTESQDWAEMLFRMYTRFADRGGFDVEVVE